jgi:hypothetical protein
MVLTDDYFLNGLVEFAERGLKLPIIVSVGGATIQGTLISEREYFERLSDLVQAESPDVVEQAEDLREMLRGLPRIADESTMRKLDEGADPEEMRRAREEMALIYIHLKDTRIMLSDGDFMGLSAPWRGKRSAVDGFWLGGTVS